MDAKKISISHYTYNLPEDKIAKHPLAERDASRLLVYKQQKITEDVFANLAAHIPENALLVFNDTKVISARLLFKKPTGGVIEIFCLEPYMEEMLSADPMQTLLQTGKVLWKCIIGGASKWKPGQLLKKKIEKGDLYIDLTARYIKKEEDAFVIELSWTPAQLAFAEILHAAGAVPLPPYIKREAEENDVERYQTIYAQYSGSVAAPTAGLHFTPSVFKKLEEKHIQHDFVTLHVGAGTFKPVKTEVLAGHEMHSEYISVSAATIKKLVAKLNEHIIAVGTTSLRTLETLYWLGVKIKLNKPDEMPELYLLQWEAYELAHFNINVKDALNAVLNWLHDKGFNHLFAKTQLLIAPGYQCKIPAALITNFHQPQSTLLLLVAALIGNEWWKVYEFALQNSYRFLSYGDGSLLWIDKDL